MTFVLPYPNSPQNGDAGNADPIRLNTQALAQAIQSFDGSQIQAASVQEAALANAINPRLRASETMNNFVYTGCVWTAVSGLNGTMTGGTIYVNGYRTLVNSIGSNTFTVSQDTYVAIDYLGNVTYWPVGNNASSPSLPANSIWVAIVVTNGTTIASVNTGQLNATAPVVSSRTLLVSDTNGQLIYPQPGQTILSYAQITSNFATSNTTATQVTGLVAPLIVPASRRRVKITVFTTDQFCSNGPVGTSSQLSIWDGAVNSGTRLATNIGTQSAAGSQYPSFVMAVASPSAGPKTYNVGLLTSNATYAANIESSATSPAFILVEAM